MTTNDPFDILGPVEEPAPEIPEYELIGGAMSCQTCYERVTEGKYFASEMFLTWKCSLGHVSSARDISL